MKFFSFIYSLLSALLLTSCNDKATDPHAGHDHSSHETIDPHTGHDHSSDETTDRHAGHDHSSDETTDRHAGHDHGKAHVFSSQAIKNLGVITEEIDSSDFTVYTPVPAEINELPRNKQLIFAPFEGRIEAVNIVRGEYLDSRQLAVSIIRAPIPRVNLTMVQDILEPASEEYHRSISELRSAVRSLELLQVELKRLQAFGGQGDKISIVPRKDLIELRYEEVKTKQQVSNHRNKMRLHGLSKKEIDQLAEGKAIKRSPDFWLNALKQNDIWNANAEKLFKTLPKELRRNRWSTATVGELAAEHLISPELLKWFEENVAAPKYFLEIARLLQDGHSITDLKNLNELGAFQRIIEVKAPVNESGWDVEKVHVKVGQNVTAGEKLITLNNQSKMVLVANPQASEIVALNKAVSMKFSIDASPLTPGVGQDLKNLHISTIAGTDTGVDTAYLPVINTPLSKSKIAGRNYRNWQLRNGLKYTLKVPRYKIEDVIILPTAAVVDNGSDKVVFVRDGEEFFARKVVVVYQNSEVAVIGEGSELLPQEEMVVQGAFALQQAILAGTSDTVDPHAGHSH